MTRLRSSGTSTATGAFDDAFGADPRVLLDGVDGPSTIDVSLRVTDDEGASATATATVEVSNADPTIDSITSPGDAR